MTKNIETKPSPSYLVQYPTPHFRVPIPIKISPQGWQTCGKLEDPASGPEGTSIMAMALYENSSLKTLKKAVSNIVLRKFLFAKELWMTKKWSSEELRFAYWNFLEIFGNEAVFMIVFFEGTSWDGKKSIWKVWNPTYCRCKLYLDTPTPSNSDESVIFMNLMLKKCCNPIAAVTGWEGEHSNIYTNRANQLRFPRSFLPGKLPEIFAFFKGTKKQLRQQKAQEQWKKAWLVYRDPCKNVFLR